MDEALKKIIAIMEQSYNKDISSYDEDFLRNSIEKRCVATESGNPAAYADYLQGCSHEAESFDDSLHIGFSRFFRDPVTFDFLEQSILPCIAANKRNGSEIRVWSAGCASGQEAYTLAILLYELAETCGKELRFRIFATDISPDAISAGTLGTYDENMILEVKTKYLNKYFTRQGTDYTIVPQLKKHVRFSIYDLLDQSTDNLPESIYGDFDMVICSNVLIYYKAAVRRAIIHKLLRAVTPGGYLITGEAEKTFIQEVTKLPLISTPTSVFQNGKRR